MHLSGAPSRTLVTTLRPFYSFLNRVHTSKGSFSTLATTSHSHLPYLLRLCGCPANSDRSSPTPLRKGSLSSFGPRHSQNKAGFFALAPY